MRICLIILVLFSVYVNGQVMTDPTRPANQPILETSEINDNSTAGVENNGSPTVVLTATFITSAGKYAIINGKTVFEGQEWNNLRLTSLQHQGIVLEGQGIRREYTLKNNNNLIKDNLNVF